MRSGSTEASLQITYALFKLGAILVPLNPAFSADQVASALNHLTATHLVIGTETNLPRKAPSSNLPLLQKIIPDLKASRLESDAVPTLQNVVIVDNATGRVDASDLRPITPYEDVLKGYKSSSLGRTERSLLPDEVVNIQFTSGTTSMPKAACLTHRSILNNGNSIGDRMLLTERDVVCCPPPLFHCFGCILGYMATATHGSAIVFPAEAFDPLATLRAVQEYQCTALYGVPTMFLAELELLSNGTVPYEGFQHLRTGIAAGTQIPRELMRRLHEVLNLTELTICYGMTETSPVSAMTTTDDPLEKRLNTVGELLPHVRAKVVDKENGEKVLNVGERGELAVNGYLVMKEYWGDSAKTAEVLRRDEGGDLWMHTGDEALIDADGYVTITGRLKDIIIRGGENIQPLEIENCLLTHPALQEISAYGVPDQRYGEVVAVSIVRRQGQIVQEDDVRAWVKGKLSGHLVPKHIFWTENFPKTASGKIQRFKLQQEAIQKLGLQT
ncbi:MAG: hypothetical protein M1828_000331 [Chrysothrix sp. TS-e1954]|nr:MAG: hypothetical protein M1828_000331 [Chrysothrix sp. TS-e1954]